MAEISLSLPDMYENAFGYKTQAFNPRFPALPNRVAISKQGSPYYADDVLGREYFMPATITYAPGASAGAPGEVKIINLSYPVISVSCNKTIVETALTERRGTVKELISTKDYEITIRGLLLNTSNDFPEDDVTALRELFEQNAAVQIKCALTDIFLIRPDRSGSDNVVITEISFPPISGVKNVRPYEIKMLSDETFNLTDIS